MNKQFSQLKQKMIGQVLFIAILAAIIGLVFYYVFVDGILQAPFAEMVVALIVSVFNVEYYEAVGVYSRIFRQNKVLWLAVGFIVILLVVFYFALSKFKNYFLAISAGIDRLAEESDQAIELPEELDFMERKLNSVKGALEKRAQDVQEAEQRKNDLVVYLAHDIKTPLTSVIGYLSLLSEASDMPVEQKAKYVDITLDKALRLEQLINEFFEITRFNLQSIVLDKEMIPLPFMLMQLADEFYPLLAPKGQQAIVHADDDIMVLADPDKLARVFNNILKNAIAYSDDNSIIEIKANQADSQVVVSFKNHGKPIPPQKLDAIFEKFYRLDSARGTQTGGSGLGLAIAKEVIVAHGGTIEATSNDGETNFTVTLPIKK